MLATVDELAGNDFVGENSAFVIDIAQKQIQRGQPLSQALLDSRPFCGGDNPGQQIVGKNSLRPLFATVHRKGDTLVQKRQVGRLLTAAQFLRSEFQQGLLQRAVVSPGHARRHEHLIVRDINLVVHK